MSFAVRPIGLAVASISGFSFTPTITSDTYNYNLRAAAVTAGWNQTDPLLATVTINSGVYVGSTAVGTYAFDTGVTFPGGSALAVVNNGFIVGRGGNGGTESTGQAGGPALRAQAAVSVTNNGTIGGGGGGGGSGGPESYDYVIDGGGNGGGGGAGYNGGTGGGGGNSGATASSGTKTAGGAGVGANSSGEGEGGGGTGGGLGSAGGTGSTGTDRDWEGMPRHTPGLAGGAGGAAVVGNSNITWLNTGTRLGSVS